MMTATIEAQVPQMILISLAELDVTKMQRWLYGDC